MKLKASRVPVELEEVSQLAGVSLDVFNECFIANCQGTSGKSVLPVVDNSLVISESPRDVLPLVRPGVLFESRSPARKCDIAQDRENTRSRERSAIAS